ncbi:hypothetical protein TNIN_462361 [Trichonephila inaurata madagascariensis]|uniref:Uncharacterized protein n=1 Tax=Trichonephila inaurata madagascariensis TaxID=2747483 RepID=A0A8X6WZ65_9ARAC|nr:hypothetical protein TNIN_462361 [Trichonephila inaurata madagascariensis]
MITENINVADGLANGALDKLTHIEFDDNSRALEVWLLFPNGVGVKDRGKLAGYVNQKEIGREMVPINRRSATVPVYRSKSIHAQRN